ncbi:acyltransferase family protein [Flavihumibacter sp.]|uniref:acyltransferase family protein n=1 Tax=Flavihumibacter sp. TaxID=1913981 RepID=UPI002FC84391
MQPTVNPTPPASLLPSNRLKSLDVLRGLIMLLLAAESCHLYIAMNEEFATGIPNAVVEQFFHHPWHGLRFWDLVQPAFMTMAGAALYISFYNKSKKGITWETNFRHVAIRCFKLFLFGTALHCIYAGKMVWELWNVLTQLAFTTLIAYAIIRKSSLFQIIFSVALLILTELLYRFVLMPGFDKPFTHSENFGAWFDTIVMGKINSDGWVAINIIPTAAHTIWGVLAGKLIISKESSAKKLKTLVIAGLVALAAGYALDLSGITPIIKRISTSSFTLASGGWILLMMALLYYIIDLRGWNRFAWVFEVMGMNAIFIYLFFETVGVQWLNGAVAIFTNGFTGLFNTPAGIQAIFAALMTLFVEWYLCYWLYKRRIFLKL